MQQRRLRLGDVLDDYCPRERRITNHAVVAMIEDDVKQTRCTTCDAEHEYKHAKVPPPRRKKPVAAVAAPPVEATDSMRVVAEDTVGETLDETVDEAPVLSAEAVDVAKEPDPVESEERPPVADDEWPVRVAVDEGDHHLRSASGSIRKESSPGATGRPISAR